MREIEYLTRNANTRCELKQDILFKVKEGKEGKIINHLRKMKLEKS